MTAGVWAAVLKFFYDVSFILTPLPIIAIVMLAISIQFFLMGLLAELLVRTYHESQDKTIYSVRETMGFDDQWMERRKRSDDRRQRPEDRRK